MCCAQLLTTQLLLTAAYTTIFVEYMWRPLAHPRQFLGLPNSLAPVLVVVSVLPILPCIVLFSVCMTKYALATSIEQSHDKKTADLIEQRAKVSRFHWEGLYKLGTRGTSTAFGTLKSHTPSLARAHAHTRYAYRTCARTHTAAAATLWPAGRSRSKRVSLLDALHDRFVLLWAQGRKAMETLRRLSSLKVLTCKARATDASSKQELRDLPAALQRELREMFDVLDKDHSGSVRLPPSALGSPLPHLHRDLGDHPARPIRHVRRD